MDIYLRLGALVCLLLLSGFFSSSETAFFSLNRIRLRRRTILKDPGYRYILNLLKTSSTFLTTVLIGNELVNISISVVAAGLVYSLAGDMFSSRLLPFLSMVLTVPVLLLFGEIVPKTLAVKFPDLIARFNSPLLYLFSKAIGPVRFLLNTAAKTFITFFVKDPSRQPIDDVNIDEDIFKSMVDHGSRAGTIEPDQRDLIHRAFRLDDIPVARIMTPRERITALPLSCTAERFLELIEREKYSRYPVYESSVDSIVGFVHAKDLLRLRHNESEQEPLSIAEILRKPTFIQAHKNALSAFLQLKRNKTHMAIVVGPEGTTVGTVTMEDILEELFGEIRDETDVEDDRDS